MWADSLLRAEQQHLIRLFVWAALSTLGGTGIAVLLVARRIRSPLLSQFATQCIAWGLAIAMISSVVWRFEGLRDVHGAARLERIVWMNVGFDVGCLAVGATLALAAWRFGKRLGGTGAGIGVMVQGLALFILNVQFAAIISR